MNKGGTASAELTLELAARMKSYGVVPEFSFVVGNPPDPAADLAHTLSFIRRIKQVNPATEIILYVYSPVPLEGDFYDAARHQGFAFPETLESWVSDKWQAFSLRRDPSTPWSHGDVRRRVRDFESVLNAYYPTVTDMRRTAGRRRLLRAASAWRTTPSLRAAGRAEPASARVPIPASRNDRVLGGGLDFVACAEAGRDPNPPVPTALEPEDAYARWAATYPPRPHNRLMEVEQTTVLELLPDVRSLTVLDAGCGTGRYARLCGDRGANIIGLDLSAPMLWYARAISPRVVCGGLCEMPLRSASVDAVVCGLALGDLEDLAAAIGECARVVRPGGTVIYSVVHPDGARHGWSRSFEVGGRLCAVKTYWHAPEDHRQACAAAGLDIDAWQEPSLEEQPGMPVALVVRARARMAQSETVPT